MNMKPNQNKKINVIDAPCGMGKTTYVIQMMREKLDRKYLFITPFLDEVQRIKTACPERFFFDPQHKGGGKLADLKSCLECRVNIASTHALFKTFDAETVELIKLGGYTLVLDEVIDVLAQQEITSRDLNILLNNGLLIKREDGTLMTLHGTDYEGRFQDIIQMAHMDKLVINDSMLFWRLPVEIFQAFVEVYNLTYMFEGQILKYYYDINRIPYQILSIQRSKNQLELIPHSHRIDVEFRQGLKGRINIYDGPMNTLGQDAHCLSKSWYDRNKGNRSVMRSVKNHITNYFRNHLHSKAHSNMWTCYKDHKNFLKGKGYTNGFVVHNKRATNEFKDKSNLVYAINRFPAPPVVNFFKAKGIDYDAELFALSEMVQWIWRSRIRDGGCINLFIPSFRMRGLLLDWLSV